MLDIEEHFMVRAFNKESESKFDGTIGSMVRIVDAVFQEENAVRAVEIIEGWEFSDENNVTRKEYNKLASIIVLPHAGIILNKKWPKDRKAIKALYDIMETNVDYSWDIYDEIVKIVRKRLRYKGPISYESNIYRDLGCG